MTLSRMSSNSEAKRRPAAAAKPVVRVKPFSYQPSKAELEEPINVRKPDGSAPSVDEVVDAVLRPVRVVEDPDA